MSYSEVRHACAAGRFGHEGTSRPRIGAQAE
jgi:hypothetical protein